MAKTYEELMAERQGKAAAPSAETLELKKAGLSDCDILMYNRGAVSAEEINSRLNNERSKQTYQARQAVLPAAQKQAYQNWQSNQQAQEQAALNLGAFRAAADLGGRTGETNVYTTLSPAVEHMYSSGPYQGAPIRTTAPPALSAHEEVVRQSTADRVTAPMKEAQREREQAEATAKISRIEAWKQERPGNSEMNMPESYRSPAERTLDEHEGRTKADHEWIAALGLDELLGEYATTKAADKKAGLASAKSSFIAGQIPRAASKKYAEIMATDPDAENKVQTLERDRASAQGQSFRQTVAIPGAPYVLSDLIVDNDNKADRNSTRGLLSEYGTDEERFVHSYIFATQGKKAADEYLSAMSTSVAARKVQEIYEKARATVEEVQGTDGALLRGAKQTGLTVAGAFEQWITGFSNFAGLLEGRDYNIPSHLQTASGTVLEGLGGAYGSVGGTALAALHTISYMIPSILIGKGVGAAAGAAGATAAGVSAATTAGTSASIFFTASGNGYANGIAQGLNPTEASVYGLLTGASEAVLQVMIGGIVEAGGGLASKLLGTAKGQTFLNAIDGALKSVVTSEKARFLLRVGISMAGDSASEFFEESLQSILEPQFLNLVTGEDIAEINIKEAIQDGLMGAIVALSMNSIPAVRQSLAGFGTIDHIQALNEVRAPLGLADVTVESDIAAAVRETDAALASLQSEIEAAAEVAAQAEREAAANVNPVEAAIDNLLATGEISSKQMEAILKTDGGRELFTERTGVELPQHLGDARRAIRSYQATVTPQTATQTQDTTATQTNDSAGDIDTAPATQADVSPAVESDTFGRSVEAAMPVKKARLTVEQRIIREQQAAIEKVTEQREKMKDQRNEYRRQLKRSKTATPDRPTVQKYAESLVRQYESRTDVRDVRDALIRLYEDAHSGVDTETLRTRANAIAESVLSASQSTNTIMREKYSGLMDYLDANAILYTPDMARIPEYGKLRDTHRGELAIRKSGKPLAEVYSDLAQAFPDIVEQGLTTPADQLHAISNALFELRPYAENIYDANLTEASEMLGEILLGDTVGLDAAKPTFADQKAEQIQKIYDQKARDALKAKVKRRAHRLAERYLRPTPQKHLQPEFESETRALLGSLDFTTDKQSEATVSRLQAWSRKFLSDADGQVADQYLSGRIADLQGTRLANMSNEDLQTIADALSSLEHRIRNANKQFTAEKAETITELVSEEIGFLQEQKKQKSNHKNAISTLLNDKMVNPANKFSELGPAMQEMWDSIYEKGFGEYAFKLRDAKEAFDKAKAEIISSDQKTLAKEIKKWTTDTFRVPLASGVNLELTPLQAMSIYLLNKQEDGRRSLLGDGIKPKQQETGRLSKTEMYHSPLALTEADIAEISSRLTPEQSGIADWMSEYSKTLAEWGNEESRAVYGYDQFTVEDYFTMYVDPDSRGGFVTGGANPSIRAWGSAKRRTGTSNPLVIDNAFNVFFRHMEGMARYSTLLAPVTDLTRLMSYRDKANGVNLLETFRSVYGNNGVDYIKTFIADASKGSFSNDKAAISEWLIRNAKKAAVAANARVIVQQPTAYVRAYDSVDAKYLTKGMFGKTSWEHILKYSPEALWKDWGYFDYGVGRSLYSLMLSESSATDKALGAINKADKITWGRLWNALEYEVADKQGLRRGTEAFNQAVAKRFSEVIAETQVIDSVFHRSEAQRSGGYWQVISAFKSEALKQYNMLRTNFLKAKADPTPQNTKRVARSAFAAAMQSFTNSLVVTAFTMFIRDKDDPEEKDTEDFFREVGNEMLDNTFGMILFLGDIWSFAQGFRSSRMDLDGIEKLVRVATDIYKGGLTPYAVGKELTSALSAVFGWPAASIVRDLDAAALKVTQYTDNEYWEYTYGKWTKDITKESNRGYFYDILYKAYSHGDMEAYERIKADLISSTTRKTSEGKILPGVTDDTIRAAMKSREVKAGGTVDYKAASQVGIGYSDSWATDKHGRSTIPDGSVSRYQDLRAGYAKPIVESIYSSPLYQDMDDNRQASAVRDAYRYAAERAEKDILGHKAEAPAWVGDASQASQYQRITPHQYILARQLYLDKKNNAQESVEDFTRKAYRELLEKEMSELTEVQRAYLTSNIP